MALPIAPCISQALLLSRLTEWREDSSFTIVIELLARGGVPALTFLLKSKKHRNTHRDIAYTLANLM
jgi:hypothetical protein